MQNNWWAAGQLAVTLRNPNQFNRHNLQKRQDRLPPNSLLYIVISTPWNLIVRRESVFKASLFGYSNRSFFLVFYFSLKNTSCVLRIRKTVCDSRSAF